MKWFPKNFSFTKYNLVQNNTGEVSILATLAEDGQVLIWDMKGFDRSVVNDTSNYIKPLIRCEINKMDCIKFVFLKLTFYIFLFYKLKFFRHRQSKWNMYGIENSFKKSYNKCCY